MATNLEYDGSTAGNGCKDITWVNWTDTGWCGYYSGGPFTNEGLLYQWSAAMNGDTQEGARGICPSGWHIPTDAEWHTLEDYFDSATCNGGRAGWGCTPAGTDLKSGGSSGFDGLLAGYWSDGSYGGRGSYAYLWSSTPDGGTAWTRTLHVSRADVFRFTFGKATGFSRSLPQG